MVQTTRRPARVYAPGRFLGEEIRARGWNWQELADHAGLPLDSLMAVVFQRLPITEAIADGLARALGTSAALWINLDIAYRTEANHQRHSA